MRRTIVIILVVIILAAAGFIFLRQRQAAQDQELEILRQATVERDDITATVSATGSIEPEALVSLSFKVGGQVQSVRARRGQEVTEGDILATLDSGELALAVQQAGDALRIQSLTLQQARNARPGPARLAAAQADVDAAASSLTIAQANLDAAEASLAQAEAQRAQVLAGPTEGQLAAAESQLASARQQREIAQDAYDQARREGQDDRLEQAAFSLQAANAAVAAAEAQLADLRAGARPADVRAANAAVQAAEAQVASARGNVGLSEANLARARAAYDGLLEGPTEDEIAILEAQVESARTNLALAELRLEQARIVAPIAGQVASVLVSQGEQAAPGTPAVTLVNESGFHIEVNVDEIDIERIAPGQPVEITLDALPNREVQGTVAEVAPTALTSGVGIVTYEVTINIASTDADLRPGMTANAAIVVDENEDVLVVPNWAIRLDRETGQAYVNRLNGVGEIEEVAVETGVRNEQVSEVLGGLEAGDVVVVTNERAGLSGFFGD